MRLGAALIATLAGASANGANLPQFDPFAPFEITGPSAFGGHVFALSKGETFHCDMRQALDGGAMILSGCEIVLSEARYDLAIDGSQVETMALNAMQFWPDELWKEIIHDTFRAEGCTLRGEEGETALITGTAARALERVEHAGAPSEIAIEAVEDMAGDGMELLIADGTVLLDEATETARLKDCQ